MADDKNPSRVDTMVKGILLGGSIGIIAGLVMSIDLPRALLLGMLCGVLGAATLHGRPRKK